MLGRLIDQLVPLLVLILAFCQLRSLSETCQAIRIGAYLPDYRFHLTKNDFAQKEFALRQLDDVFLFSIPFSRDIDIVAAGQSLLNSSGLKNLAETDVGRNVNVFVTIGGGGRSDDFYYMIREERQSLVSALLRLHQEFSIDGFDFDPEIRMNETLYEELYQLIKELKVSSGGEIIISLAVHYWQKPGKVLADLLDRVNVMSYDLQAGQHSPFHRTKEIAQDFQNSGIPKEKIFMGIPLYGRHEDDPHQAETFSELVQCSSDAPEKEIAFGSYSKGYAYNGQALVKLKTEWAMAEQLGGVFFWELGQDCLKRDFSLMEYARTVVSLN